MIDIAFLPTILLRKTVCKNIKETFPFKLINFQPELIQKQIKGNVSFYSSEWKIVLLELMQVLNLQNFKKLKTYLPEF